MDDARLTLRARALTAASEAEPRPHSEVWEALVRGQHRIEDTLNDGPNCYLILSYSPTAPAGMKPTHQAILERILRGDCQKHVAIDFDLANSTVATVAKQALTMLGLNCQPSRVPLAVVLLAQSTRKGSPYALTARLATFEHSWRTLQVVSIRRPDGRLSSILPPAEADVVRARLEGWSHKLIADERHTSTRTVANQLASASRRLGTSGRLATISRLVAAGADYQPPALAS